MPTPGWPPIWSPITRLLTSSLGLPHRALYRVTRGRAGLWPPKPNRWGTMRLTTIGRRTGQQRSVILEPSPDPVHG